MNELRQVRTLEVVAAEIRAYTNSMLCNVIEIGRRMAEAKEMVPYGEFGSWIKENTGYSLSAANNFMRLYTEYGAAQVGIFGAEAECQTIGKLSYTKALALLSVPAEERETFVQENDVEAMTTRQLKEAIRERDEARQEAEGAVLQLAELEDQRLRAEKQLEKANETAEDLRRQIKDLESRPVEVAVQHAEQADIDAALAAQSKKNDAHMKELREKLQAAATREADLQKALEDVKGKLKTAKEKAKTAAQQGAADAEAAAQIAKAEAEAAKQENEQLRKALAMADPVTAEFKVHFASAQNELQACLGLLETAAPETADKLKKALSAMLTSTMGAVGAEVQA